MPAESNSPSYGMNIPLKLLAYIYCSKILDQTLTHNYPSSSSYLLMWNRGKLLGSTIEVKLSSKATVLTKHVVCFSSPAKSLVFVSLSCRAVHTHRI